MQSGTSLKSRLKTLFDVIENEAMPKSGQKQSVLVPDVFASLQEKGDEEFRFWLRTLDLPTLRAVVKQNGFDPARVSQRWKDTDKFIALVHDQTQARLKRGSAFLPPKAPSQTPDE
jgi:hypothetical protein